MQPKPNLTIFGPGSVGKALLKTLSESGYEALSVISRRPEKSRPEISLPELQVISLHSLCEENTGHLLFITTSDDSIGEACRSLANSGIDWEGRVVAHCSGYQTSKLLQPLADRGASVASFHPLQTFSGMEDGSLFQDIYISIEGDDEAVSVLRSAALDMGSKPVLLDAKQKALLHIAAVFLSNYLVSLGGYAETLIRSSIPDEGLKLLTPLLTETARKLSETSPSESLTGPVSRGDIDTIQNHLKMLEDRTELKEAYKLLGREALRLATVRGELSGEKREQIRKLFRDE